MASGKGPSGISCKAFILQFVSDRNSASLEEIYEFVRNAGHWTERTVYINIKHLLFETGEGLIIVDNGACEVYSKSRHGDKPKYGIIQVERLLQNHGVTLPEANDYARPVRSELTPNSGATIRTGIVVSLMMRLRVASWKWTYKHMQLAIELPALKSVLDYLEMEHGPIDEFSPETLDAALRENGYMLMEGNFDPVKEENGPLPWKSPHPLDEGTEAESIDSGIKNESTTGYGINYLSLLTADHIAALKRKPKRTFQFGWVLRGQQLLCQCLKCEYSWISRRRSEDGPPAVCPKCHSKAWDRASFSRCVWCGHVSAGIDYRQKQCPACKRDDWLRTPARGKCFSCGFEFAVAKEIGFKKTRCQNCNKALMGSMYECTTCQLDIWIPLAVSSYRCQTCNSVLKRGWIGRIFFKSQSVRRGGEAWKCGHEKYPGATNCWRALCLDEDFSFPDIEI